MEAMWEPRENKKKIQPKALCTLISKEKFFQK